MPLANPTLPNLAVEQLAEISRDAGLACDVFYGTLLLSRSVPAWLIQSYWGQAIFAPTYHGLDPDLIVRELLDAYNDFDRLCHLGGERDLDEMAIDLLLSMERAEECLEACLEAIAPERYDLACFSVAFDAQRLASACLARLLKRREPGIQVLFGGTACDGPMAAASLRVFPEVDAVLSGEAVETFTEAVLALRGARHKECIPGLYWRDGSRIGIAVAEGRSPSIHELPSPRYSEFIEQRSRSQHAASPLILMFESSRGCWWGRKHHCSFCGIQNVRQPYRSREAGRVLAELLDLQDRYHPDLLYATDAILDQRSLRSLLPELARVRRQGDPGIKLFYEIKSNLRREEVAVLAAAGVVKAQPGIESLSTALLRSVDKGSTAVRQVALLKWFEAYRISAVYGLILGLPSERPEDYLEMTRLARLLHHLPPPLALNRLGLHKFSPYYYDPTRYGFSDIRPFTSQRVIYRAPDQLLVDLCYELNYTLPGHDDPELRAARAEFGREVICWISDYYRGLRQFCHHHNGVVTIIRCLGGGWTDIRTVTGLEAQILDRSAEPRSVESLSKELGVDVETVDRVAMDLEGEGLGLVCDGVFLALSVPVQVDSWHDAGVVCRDESSAVPEPVLPRS
jgi:ribosomal peptide maturation radical SAM protein 1